MNLGAQALGGYTVFGRDSLMGAAVTGLVRIPAFLSSLVAVSIVAELSIRGLTTVLQTIGFEPAEKHWIQKTAQQINGTALRPFQDRQNWPSYRLAVQAAGFAAVGIVGSEFVRVLGGPAPAIYNNVLTLIGCVRIDSRSYVTAVNELLSIYRR